VPILQFSAILQSRGTSMGAGAGSIANSKVLANDEPDSHPSSGSKVRKGKSETTASTEDDLVERVQSLEALVHQQAQQLKLMAKALEGVQKDVRRTVSVMQYNILASYLGKNTQPWFLYGADIEPEAREKVFKLFNQRGTDGKPQNKWPEYVKGILSPQQIEEVELQDAFFRWESRREKLVNKIMELDADVLSLVELDDHAFFAQSLDPEWDSVFRKRPRANSADGCGIFWRRRKFELVASEGFDMIDGNDDKGREKRDRSCLMVLLKWKTAGNNVAPLVVVSTHLAKDPYNKAQTAIRVRQVTQIMATLTTFTGKHQARDSPVILLGDLNARHFGEIRGIARTVWQIKGDPIHKFLWHATDVNTGATSVTKARHCRIDVVQYLSSHMEVLDVMPMPKLKDDEVIPNAEHPSDHFPVFVTFMLKDGYEKHRECARAWLECVAGREKVHPLSNEELRDAFEFFDRDRNECIHLQDLEEACFELRSNFHVDVPTLLLECFPENQISFEDFLRAYEASLRTDRMRAVGDLECAFRYFAGDAESIHPDTLEAAFREITPISFSDDEVKDMIGRVSGAAAQASVHLRDFCEVVCRATFPNREGREALVVASTPKSSRDVTPHGRMGTKEMGNRLHLLQKAVSGKGLTVDFSPQSEGSNLNKFFEED